MKRNGLHDGLYRLLPLVILSSAHPLLLAANLPVGTRSWETVPNVIRSNGQDSFRLMVNTNMPVDSVKLENLSLFFIPPNAGTIELRDDGLGGDDVAGDFVYTIGSFRFDHTRPFSNSYLGAPPAQRELTSTTLARST